MARSWPAGLLLLGGCCAGVEAPSWRQIFDDGAPQGTALVPDGPAGPVRRVAARPPGPPAAPETARRVAAVGERLAAADEGLGLRPRFGTIAAPTEEVFHRGVGEVFVTEGLVKRCGTEGRLAAVLAHELGRMAAEREALVPPEARQPQTREPQEVRVGTDAGGPFGPADGTRLAELAQYERERHRPDVPPPAPSPAAIARSLLRRAGYDPAELSDVAPLLRAAEAHADLERQLTGAVSPGG
jgi:predicted Zn-dependent protease